MQQKRLTREWEGQEGECDKRYGWFSAADFQTVTQQIHAKFLGPRPAPPSSALVPRQQAGGGLTAQRRNRRGPGGLLLCVAGCRVDCRVGGGWGWLDDG